MNIVCRKVETNRTQLFSDAVSSKRGWASAVTMNRTVAALTFCCRVADVPASACTTVAALAVALVLAAAREETVVVLVHLLAVAALADDAFGLFRTGSKHGPRRLTCVQVFGCSTPQAL